MKLGLNLGLTRRSGGGFHDGAVADFVSRSFGVRAAGGPQTVFGDAQSMFSWSSSLKWVRGAAGVLVPSAANQPAYEWNAAGAALGARFEPSRSNVLKDSASINGSSNWTGYSGFAPASVTSFIQGQTATRLTGAGGGSQAIVQNAGTPGAVAGTLSVILENVDASVSHVGLYTNTGGGWVGLVSYAWATDATAVAGGAAVNISVEQLGAGPNGGKLVRLSFESTPAAGHSCAVYVFFAGTPATSASAIVHHAQYEAGSGATSVIVTTTATVTRNADSVSRTLGAEWGEPEGTIFVKGVRLGASPSVQALVRFDDNTNGNNIALLNSLTTPRFQTSRSGTVDLGVGLDGTLDGSAMKFAARYKDGDYARVSNSAIVRKAAATGVVTPAMTRMRLGSAFFAGNELFGYLHRIETWPSAFNDAQLQALVA